MVREFDRKLRTLHDAIAAVEVSIEVIDMEVWPTSGWQVVRSAVRRTPTALVAREHHHARRDHEDQRREYVEITACWNRPNGISVVNVSVVDTAANSVVAAVPVGAFPIADRTDGAVGPSLTFDAVRRRGQIATCIATRGLRMR